jgi:hypothetical protein
VGNQHGAAQHVSGDEKVELVAQQAKLDEAGAAAIGEPCRPAGNGEAVIVWQP